MASDSFTNTDHTAIGSHTAGGVTWAAIGGNAEAIGEIMSNQLRFGDLFSISARASSSSSDFCQVVIKAGTYVAQTKSVHVRSSASALGYQLRIDGITGDNIDSVSLYKNELFLTFADVSGLSKSRLVDHTLAIKATPSGGDVQIKGYIDGTEITFDASSASNPASSTTYTDLAAETPLAAGNPGLTVAFETGMVDANSGLDDWTDTQGGGGGGAIRKATGMSGGFSDLSGGLE